MGKKRRKVQVLITYRPGYTGYAMKLYRREGKCLIGTGVKGLFPTRKDERPDLVKRPRNTAKRGKQGTSSKDPALGQRRGLKRKHGLGQGGDGRIGIEKKKKRERKKKGVQLEKKGAF